MSRSGSTSGSASGSTGAARQWFELNAHVRVCLGDKGPRFGVIEPPTFNPISSASAASPPHPPSAAAAAAAAAQPPPPPLPRLDAASTRLLTPAADAYLALRRHEEEGAVRGDKARAIAGMLASSAEHYAQRTAVLEARVAAAEQEEEEARTKHGSGGGGGGGGGGDAAREELQRHLARSAERDGAERMLAQEAHAHEARRRTLRAQLKTRLRELRDKLAQRDRPLELNAAPQPPPQQPQQQPRARRRSTLSKPPAHRRRTSSAASSSSTQQQRAARRRSSAAPSSAKSSFRRPTTASAAAAAAAAASPPPPPLLPPAAAAPQPQPPTAVVVHAPAAATLPPPVPLTSVYLQQHTRSPSLGGPLPPCDGTVAPYGGPAEALAAAARIEGGGGGGSDDDGGGSCGSGGGGSDFVSEASSDEAGVFGGLFLNMKYLWPEKVSSYRTRPPPEEEDSVDHFTRPVLGCTPCFRRPRYANPRMPFYRYLIAAPPPPPQAAPVAARPPLLDRRPSDAVLGRVSKRWKTRRRAEAQAEAEAEAKAPPPPPPPVPVAPPSPKQRQIAAAAATVAPQQPQPPAPAPAPAPTLMAALQQRRRQTPATRGQLCRGSACLAPRVVGEAAAAAAATAAPLSPAALVVGTAADLVDTSAPWYAARQPGPTIALAL